MDIQEIRKLRAESENRIKDIITEFCQQTGVLVTRCRFEIMGISQISGTKKVSMPWIALDLEI